MPAPDPEVVVVHYRPAPGAPIETARIELKAGADWADLCNAVGAKLGLEILEVDERHDAVMRRRAAASRAKYEEERRRR